MAALVDRGDSRAVTYLGSSMLTTTSTGLGILQKPLRDLYFAYRQAGGNPESSKQRYLTMSSRGLTMTWRDQTKNSATEVFYAMPNILFWDAVQFVVVKGTKKLCGAFEPLDNDHSRNKDNLFVVLDKKYHFLQQMRHPCLFVCVLRRTTGVKALDIHVFVCSNDEEALGLVRGLNTIQDSYNENQVNETGAFSYRPFSTAGDSNVPVPAMSRHVAGSTVSGMGQPNVPESANLQHLAAQNALAAAAAARESQSHQLDDQLGHKSNDPMSARSNGGQQQRMINLTQDDFQPFAHSPPERVPFRGQKPPIPEPRRSGVFRIDEEENEERARDPNVYQYIHHINDTDPAAVPAQDSRGFSPPNTRGAHAIASQQDRSNNNVLQSYDQGGHFAGKGPQEYQSMTRSIDFNSETLSATALRPSKLIARFEEKSKATAAVRPQSIAAPKVGPKTAPKPVPSPVDRGQGKLGQGYSLLSGSGSPLPGQDDRRFESNNAPSPYPRPRSSSPGYSRELPEDSSLPRQHLIPSAFYAHQDDKNSRGYDDYKRDYQPPRVPERSTPIAADAWRPAPTQHSETRYQNQPAEEQPLIRQHQPFPFDRPRSFGDKNSTDQPPPARPVAKVTPHKVSGVGVRVLPPNPALPSRGPGDRPTSRVNPLAQDTQLNMPEDFHGAQPPPRRAKSQYYEEQKFHAEGYGSQERREYEQNWKFQPTDKPDTQKDPKKGDDSDKNMSEKLLLSKKKDAEIASVMQNLRFDYDSATVTPGVPAGNNFEKSLGYFP